MPPPRKPGGRREGFGGRKYTPRRKVCTFCVDKIAHIDYKDVPRLRRHLSERGKIEPRRKTGTCAKHQRALAIALKRARHVALLPYTAEHIRLSGMVMRSPDDRRRDDRPRAPIGEPRPAEAADGTAPGTPEATTNGEVAAASTAESTVAEAAVAEPPAPAAESAPTTEAEVTAEAAPPLAEGPSAKEATPEAVGAATE